MRCTCCDRFLKSSSIAVNGTNLLITVESTPNLTDLRRYCLLLAQPLPAGANTLPVQIQIGETAYQIYNRSGNYLRADQIRCRKLYCMVYGNDPAHFSLTCYVPETAYSVTTTSTSPAV